MKQNINILLKTWKTGLELCKNPKDFIYYSDNMQDVHNNTDEYNPAKEHKVLIVLLIVFNDMIAGVFINKKLNQIVTELYIRGRN